MALGTWFSFALISLLFCLIPGPSVCFTVAYALEQGIHNALASIAGQLSANGLYILAAAFGLGRLVGEPGAVLTGLKVCGSAYLVYLGLVQWCAPPVRLNGAGGGGSSRGVRAGFGRGFLVCATNPKTLLYYAAVLPPFISSDHDTTAQLAVLSATGVLAGGLVLVVYALLADRVRHWLSSAGRSRVGNRVAGGLMVAAAAYLALGR